jgi:hypothetical protein
MAIPSEILYLIINNSFIIAIYLINIFRNSKCKRMLCGSCLELDEAETSTQQHNNQIEIPNLTSQIHNDTILEVKQ